MVQSQLTRTVLLERAGKLFPKVETVSRRSDATGKKTHDAQIQYVLVEVNRAAKKGLDEF